VRKKKDALEREQDKKEKTRRENIKKRKRRKERSFDKRCVKPKNRAAVPDGAQTLAAAPSHTSCV